MYVQLNFLVFPGYIDTNNSSNSEKLSKLVCCFSFTKIPKLNKSLAEFVFFLFQGALVSAGSDDTLHLWNLRQKRPAILHSLKFNRER